MGVIPFQKFKIFALTKAELRTAVAGILLRSINCSKGWVRHGAEKEWNSQCCEWWWEEDGLAVAIAIGLELYNNAVGEQL